jgi:hypothetical protein
MVESVSNTSGADGEARQNRSPFLSWIRGPRPRVRAGVLVVTLLAGVAWALSSAGGGSTAQVSNPGSSAPVVHRIGTAVARPAGTTIAVAVAPLPTTTTTTVAAAPVKAPPVAVVAPEVAPVSHVVAPTVSDPSLPNLVAEVEASGIEPGSNWNWSIGDTSAHCGAISGAGTGCTYGSNGLEYTLFSGSPTLDLVAHELANAETQNDAVPSLLNEVAVAAAGSSWSPTDAVASCLVAHFMGIQDLSAGSWQCPAGLAASVAANIHDSL